MRFEHQNEANSVVTWRLAAAYDFGRSQVFASAATGFRSPSLFELFSPDFGNDDLDAQENLSLILVIVRRFIPDLSSVIRGFHIEFTDFIDFRTLTSLADPFTGESTLKATRIPKVLKTASLTGVMRIHLPLIFHTRLIKLKTVTGTRQVINQNTLLDFKVDCSYRMPTRGPL